MIEINEKAIALYHRLDHIFEIDRAERAIENAKLQRELEENTKGTILKRNDKL